MFDAQLKECIQKNQEHIEKNLDRSYGPNADPRTGVIAKNVRSEFLRRLFRKDADGDAGEVVAQIEDEMVADKVFEELGWPAFKEVCDAWGMKEYYMRKAREADYCLTHDGQCNYFCPKFGTCSPESVQEMKDEHDAAMRSVCEKLAKDIEEGRLRVWRR